jgi:hypothetical protein
VLHERGGGANLGVNVKDFLNIFAKKRSKLWPFWLKTLPLFGKIDLT